MAARMMEDIGLIDAKSEAANAALEYRAERVEGLFRCYVERLHAAQTSMEMTDWFEVGEAWKFFVQAANEAEIDPRATPFGSSALVSNG